MSGQVFVSQKNGIEFVPTVTPGDAIALYRHLQDADSGKLIKTQAAIKAVAIGATIRDGVVVRDEQPAQEGQTAQETAEEMQYEEALKIVKENMQANLEADAKAARSAVGSKQKQA